MELKEWALILFTVLVQASIGAFILLASLRLRNRDEAMDGVYRKAAVAVLPVALVGLIASVLHLGRPMLALSAMTNIGSSWLSREIFFTGGFFALLVGSILLERSPSIRKLLDMAAALFGVASMVSMAMVYHMSMRPAWQGWSTYAAFIGTALLVGAGLAASLIAWFGRENPKVTGDMHLLVGGAVIVLILGLVAYPLYLASLSGAGSAAAATLNLLGGEYSVTLVLRWALTLAGGLVPLVLSWRRIAEGRPATGLVYTAFAFLLAGELVGRYLFYVTGVSISIG